jgi:hypothetical protein
MKSPHMPTLGVTVVIVIVAIMLYHFGLKGKKL